MEILPVNNTLYDRRGEYQKYFKKRLLQEKNIRTRLYRPIDSIVFDLQENQKESTSQEVAMLKAYINALPDEEVNHRMKIFKNSFSDLDSALIEKLIIEAL